MRLVLLVMLIALVSGCSDDSRRTASGVRATAPVSRGANGDCLRAWNAPGNVGNRAAAASKHDGWSASTSTWVVSHPDPTPSGDDLIGEGCSYFFYSTTRWQSYSGAWEADGDLRWGTTPAAGGRRTAEQQTQPPNAVLRQGKLAALAAEDGGPISAREWKAVIDDWYDNGEFNDTHRCGAVREAIARVPVGGPTSHTARDDLLAFAEQVC